MSQSIVPDGNVGLYQETEPGIFSRKCLGTEAMTCATSEHNGLLHCTFSAGVTFAKVIPAHKLQPLVHRALVRLRHFIPSVACKTLRLPTREFRLSYEVPKTLDDAHAWAVEIVKFYEDKKTLAEHNLRVSKERFWKASEHRYTMELHIAPDWFKESWSFTLSTHHSNVDARTSFMIFEQLFVNLSEEINQCAPALESLEWGRETCRLPMAAPMVWSVEKTGSPEPLPAFDGILPPPPEGYVPWLYNPLRLEGAIEDDYQPALADVVLTKEETSRFHEACKEHGRKVTKVVDALLLLTDVESSLRIAGNVGPERFKEVSSTMHAATHIFKGLNAVNMREQMPESYRSFGTERCTPMISADIFPLSFPIEPYRKLVKPDLDNLSAVRQVDKAVFWDAIVKDVVEAWDKEDTTPTGYRSRAAIFTAMGLPEQLDLAPFINSGLQSTSFGDYTRLNILENFRPSSGNKTLIVHDIDNGIRWGLPSFGPAFYQYDGRLRIKLRLSRNYATDEDMQLRARILRRWFDELVY